MAVVFSLNKKVYAILLAGGSGSRMGFEKPKQLASLSGKPVITHTLKVFQNSRSVDEIYIVMEENHMNEISSIVTEGGFTKVTKILTGGKTRNESTFFGLQEIQDSNALVLVHDAVRPFVDHAIIEECVSALAKFEAVDTAIESADTLVKVNRDLEVVEILKRSEIWRGQTPQGFQVAKLLKAYQIARSLSDVPEFTDDCGLYKFAFPEAKIKVVRGNSGNIKLTEPIDFHLAEKIFQTKHQELGPHGDEDLSSVVSGKKILVIGASRGIGASILEMGKTLGATSVGLSRTINNVDINDFGKTSEFIERLAAEYGGFDAAIITAGSLKPRTLGELTTEDIELELRTNLISVINTVRILQPIIKKSGGSITLFTSSSYTRGRAGYSLYSASKAALVNLMQALADEWRNEISINCMNPERTDTPMRRSAFGEENSETLLSPEVVARATLAVAFSGITGQVIDVRLNR